MEIPGAAPREAEATRDMEYEEAEASGRAIFAAVYAVLAECDPQDSRTHSLASTEMHIMRALAAAQTAYDAENDRLRSIGFPDGTMYRVETVFASAFYWWYHGLGDDLSQAVPESMGGNLFEMLISAVAAAALVGQARSNESYLIEMIQESGICESLGSGAAYITAVVPAVHDE